MGSSTGSWKALGAAALSLLASTASAQTYTSCNPTSSTSCPADTALGMTISVDFTQGGVNSFTTSGGTPTYGTDGATFTVAKSGDSPQINSVFYIMFGRVEVTMKAAPGTGIVSSVVLLSDDLDEIDFEWLGGDSANVQTNYFGKGNTNSPNLRGLTNPAANNQAQYITYGIDWTADRIIWSVGGVAVRTMTYNDAISGQYPQTPMRLQIGAWAGGDSSNSQGTIDWAGGLTDYSQGPFSMHVKSLVVADYSTGKSYSYGDTSGTWQSIVANGGAVNGRKDTAGSLTVTASAAAVTNSSPTVPAGGIANPSQTGQTAAYQSSGTIPSGWVMTSSGKIVPASSTTDLPTPLSSSGLSPSASWPLSSAATLDVATLTDSRGFLTTVTSPAGGATSATALLSKATAAPPASGGRLNVDARAVVPTLALSCLLGTALPLLLHML